nr:TetR family transcriptional regulator C-terminal domain-containing protein [Pseudomonas asplenii]
MAALFWVGWECAVPRARMAQQVRPRDIFFQGFLAGITR